MLSLKLPIAVRKPHLAVKHRIWLYDVIGFRAEMGNINSALPDMIKEIRRDPGRDSAERARLLERIHQQGGRSGALFCHTLRGLLPHDEYNIIYAAEKSGQLHIGLSKALSKLQQKRKQSKGIKGVLKTIAARIGLLVVVMSVVGQMLFGNLATLTPVDQWPSIAQSVYRVCTTTQYWVPALLLIIALIGGGIYVSLTRWAQSPARAFAMRYLQPWGIHRMMTASSVMDAFIALSGSYAEAEIIKQLTKAAPANNIWLRQCLHMMKERVGTGAGNPLKGNPMLPPELAMQLNVMGEGNKTPFYRKAIERLDAEVEDAMLRIQKKVELMGMMALYTAVGFIFIAYFSVALSAMQQN